MAITLEGELTLTGTASDGASVVVPVTLDGLFPNGVGLVETAQAMDALGGEIREAFTRAQAMLAAGLSG